MSSVSSASSSRNTSRISGLVSGLDTESIVEQMLSASKAKIDKAKQQKTILEWKQESYRSILARLKDFQTEYFGTSGSSFASSLLKLSAACSSPYVSVTPSSSSAEGSIYISDIVSLASSASMTSSSPVSSDPVITVNTESLADLAGKSIVVTLDGTENTLTFSEGEYQTSEDVANALSSMLASAFGADRVSLSLQDDKITLSASNSALSISIPESVDSNPTGILDFNGSDSNRLDLTAALTDCGLAALPVSDPYTGIAFRINGVPFSFSSNDTLSKIISAINKSDAGVKISYSDVTDKFTISSTATGSASGVSVEDTSGSLMASLFGAGVYKSGTDAVVKLSLNGSAEASDQITLTRSSNVFNVNGTTIKLLGKAAGDAEEGISIGLSYDAGAIADKISSFISDYNDLLGAITKLTSEEVYSDYQPLTDDEREELTESQQDAWTAKARSGILRNDLYLTSIATELRSSIYTVVEGLGTLTSLGITTGSYSEQGKLYVDKDKLVKALTENPEDTLALFTNESGSVFSLYATEEQQQTRFRENGVLARISDIIKKNLNSVGKKGALIMLVGSPNSSYTSETEYSKRIKNLEIKIDDMEEALTKEEDRYWEQFTAMETALSKLYSQSAYLASMFSSGSN